MCWDLSKDPVKNDMISVSGENTLMNNQIRLDYNQRNTLAFSPQMYFVYHQIIDFNLNGDLLIFR